MDYWPQKETKVVVDFLKVEYGNIFIVITVGEQKFETQFVYLYDPMYNFKKWLESIVIGAQKTSFEFETEEDDPEYPFPVLRLIEFIFEQRNNVDMEKGILTIWHADDKENPPPICSYVNKKQLVEAFYLGCIDFFQSEKYDFAEWESEHYRERICLALNMSEEELIRYMLKLNREEVGYMLFKANPIYEHSFRGAKDAQENWELCVDSMFGKEINEKYEEIETPIYWDIPEDYDSWKVDKKREFIVDTLDSQINHYYGSNISEFKSKIVDTYLLGKDWAKHDLAPT